MEEYHRMVESGVLDDRNVELIRGEIAELPPEGKPHAYAVSESGEYLARLLGDDAKIRYGNPITLPNESEPQSDIAIVQRLGREYLGHHPYPENVFWLIEYSDTSLSKDLNLKSQIYAEASISEYWIVNLATQELIAFRNPQNDQYLSQASYTDGQIKPLSFPEISVDIQAIINRL
ncbi:MAG: Uma2 family endonuclease [Cyanobacteria bacterium J06632_3]